MHYCNCWRWTAGFLLLALIAAAPGCTRSRYRCAADKQIYGLIGRGTCDPRWQLKDYSITPQPASRMFDPDNPDRPPQPPDDPTSHTLMECVDGMKGWKHWGRNGYTPYTENPCWLKCLPRNAEGAVPLDRATAMRLALLNSREYQDELETLYLSALDVSFQRYRFDFLFFGNNSTLFTADGPDRVTAGGASSSLLQEDNGLEMTKLTATGGELVTGVANSLVWQFAGPDEYAATTLLDFSFVQPLLRAGGRAVVLENLTQSERALLANIRQMERFRHGFYTKIVAGGATGAGPTRAGPSLSALYPPGYSGAGGLLALLESQVLISNQRANVARLRSNLDQLEAFYEAGRIDSLQVDQTRQSLYSAQNTLLSLLTGYENDVDSYKMTLGLPPDLPVSVNDPLLERFDLIDARTVAAQEVISDLLAKLRDPAIPVAAADYAIAFRDIPEKCQVVLKLVEDDMQTLEQAIPARIASLQQLTMRKELKNGDVDPSVASLPAFQKRVNAIRNGFNPQYQSIVRTLAELEKLAPQYERLAAQETPTASQNAAVAAEIARRRKPLLDVMTQLSLAVSEYALTEASARVESATLTPVALSSVDAVAIARENRLDWMNARADLVDTWRQIEVAANDLLGDLSVTFSGDMSTLDNNPLKFRSTTGRLRVGLQFDPPLTRLAERNVYREALIDYQRARRQYYAFEDRVSQTLRSTLRTIGQYQLDFEVRRGAVRVAISQVDFMQLRLNQPPKPGETNVFGATTARDLASALSSLLGAQNSFLSSWVNYESLRLNLDFNLGTMRLDAQGNWIDPGPIELETVVPQAAAPAETTPAPLPEEVPMPEPLAPPSES